MDAYVHEERLDERMLALANLDHGIVDVDGLRALGASRTQIGRRIDAGRLTPLHRGVYAYGHRRLTSHGIWLAAVRAIGKGAVLSFIQGAALHGLRPPPGGKVNVTVRSKGRRQRKGIRVHATLDLPADHVTVVDRIPVTTVARTLADLAATLDTPALMRAIEAAERRKLLDVPTVLAVSAGREGAPRLATLLQRETPHTRSDFEAALVAICDDYAIPRPVTSAQVHGYEVDAYWPDRKLAVELDSWEFHGTRQAFEVDRERDAELHGHGITTLRFTYTQVTTRRQWVARRLAPRSRRGSSASRRSAA
jgi:very-short-patch-repair endonuclease